MNKKHDIIHTPRQAKRVPELELGNESIILNKALENKARVSGEKILRGSLNKTR
jgi:hypothetical protein